MRPAFLKILLPPGFSLLIFSSSCHNVLLWEKSDVSLSNRSNLLMFLGRMPSPLFFLNPIPVPLCRMVICRIVLLIVIYGFTQIPAFMCRPKPILIMLKLFRLMKGIYRSSCPHLSMEVLYWLLWMSVSSERDPLIVSSLVIAYNNTCSILVRLVFYDRSVVDWWSLYFPIRLYIDGVGRFSMQAL